MATLYKDANAIIAAALFSAQPDTAVREALSRARFEGGLIKLVAVGKAAWQMAKSALDVLGDRVSGGVVITKYGHSGGTIPGLDIFEAGHPVPDDNSFSATKAALDVVCGLNAADTVVLLLSGGGSALFEKPLIPKAELAEVTAQLLASGADIVEMNTLRKRLSAVKGGRFAEFCKPARVFSIVLSDIIGDPLDMIASGPAFPDSSSVEQAMQIVSRYGIRLSEAALLQLKKDMPKALDNSHTQQKCGCYAEVNSKMQWRFYEHKLWTHFLRVISLARVEGVQYKY